MKTRNDFVSNSSSSSYIVIASSGQLCSSSNMKACHEAHMNYNVPNREHGCFKFGWQDTAYYTLEDKLNWCGIILLDLYAACRNAELKAAWTDKTVEQTCSEYESWRNKYLKWKAMLEKVCKERLGFGVHLDLDWLKMYGANSEDDKRAFVSAFECCIDHQSNIFESPDNGAMFESEDMLYNFLAYEGSYIQCGNDND